MTTKKHSSWIIASCFASAVASILFSGCESSDDKSGDYWTTEKPKPAQTAPAETQTSSSSSSSSGSSSASSSSSGSSSGSSNSSSSSSSGGSGSSGSSSASSSSSASGGGTTAEAGAADEVPFGSLSWTYGGVNGGKAKKSSASIGHLSVGASSLSYRWTGPTLSSWGLSNGDPGAYACFFVQRSNGKWVGGKFDWISTSRTSRGFENIRAGYGGWTLTGVPNPCPCAFVIVSSDCKKRTNVLAGTWKR